MRQYRRIDYKNLTALYCKGLSHRNIAKELKCSVISVNTILCKLRKVGSLKRRSIDIKKQGENHNRAKLTEKDVRQIILRVLGGEREIDLAKIYKLDYTTIRGIVRGKSWKYLFQQYEKELRKEILSLKNKYEK